jgi:hypothetical protein
MPVDLLWLIQYPILICTIARDLTGPYHVLSQNRICSFCENQTITMHAFCDNYVIGSSEFKSTNKPDYALHEAFSAILILVPFVVCVCVCLGGGGW